MRCECWAEANGVSFGFQALGRLRPGVTRSQANTDVARMIPLLDQIPRYASLRLEPNVRPLDQDVIGNIGQILWLPARRASRIDPIVALRAEM